MPTQNPKVMISSTVLARTSGMRVILRRRLTRPPKPITGVSSPPANIWLLSARRGPALPPFDESQYAPMPKVEIDPADELPMG